MKYTITFIGLCVFLCSCLNQKYLAKNQTIFRVDTAGMSSEIRAYSNKNDRIQVNVEETNGILFIKKVATDTGHFTLLSTVQSNFYPKGSYAQLELNSKYYFSETTFPKENDPNSNQAFTVPPSLKYSENRLVLQALSIPIKIRPKIKSDRYKDSLPTQAETGFNAGIAGGIKRTWNIFKPDLNLFGQNTIKLSAATGLLFNVGATDVKKSTTNYTIVVDRKEPFYSYGWFFLFGFNNINIGYSIGNDHLFSKNSKNWVYQGKTWHGITLALDILK